MNKNLAVTAANSDHNSVKTEHASLINISKDSEKKTEENSQKN